MIRSDDFNGGALAAFWSQYVGEPGASIGVGGGNLLINQMDNTIFWSSGNNAACVAQAAPSDFDVELGIGVLPSVAGQQCGLIALDDPVNPQNYLLCGPAQSAGFNMVLSRATLGGATATFHSAAPAVPPNVLRLHRAGNNYSCEISDDGVTFVPITGGTWATPLPYVGIFTMSFFSANFASTFLYFENLNAAAPNAPIFGASV